MSRVGIAKVGFVFLGAWLIVISLFEAISFLLWMPLSEAWEVLVFGGLLIGLGVLLLLWSGRLAQRAVGSQAEPERGSLRLVDIQSTCIALLGLLVLTWWFPRALVQLHRVPEIWRTWGTEENNLFSPKSLFVQELVAGLVASIVGLWLVLRSRSLAASWTRRLGGVTFQPSPDAEPETQRRGKLADLQAVAISLLGIYLVAEGLPELVVLAMNYDIRSPFEWTLEEQPVWYGQAAFMTELLRVGLGVALFLGAHGLASTWHRMRATITAPTSKPLEDPR